MNNKKAQKWQNRFSKAEDAQRQLFKRVSKYYDIMYSVQNTDNVAPWRSKVYIPILASKAWDLIARLSNVTPYFQTKVEDIEFEESVPEIDPMTGEEVVAEQSFKIPEATLDRQKRLDAKLKKDYTNSDEPMKLKVADTLMDAVVAGTGWAKVSWEVKEKQQYSKQIDDDGMVMNPDKDVSDSTEYGCNSFDPQNFFNVFVSPNVPSWGKANYIIVRSYKPFDDLRSDSKYDLSKLYGQTDTANFSTDNNARNRVVNEQTLLMNDDSVETATIYECYERRGHKIFLTTYALGGDGGKNWIEIRPESKKYWHKYFPIVPFYIRKKSFSPFGESLFENNATLVAALTTYSTTT